MKIQAIRRAEWIIAIALSVTVLLLLIVRATHAGALWRDECTSVQLAEMPSFADILANLPYDSFPLLFPATIRVYAALFGSSDASLRCFGFAVGLALVGVAWFNSRSTNRDVPLVFLALIGLNSTFVIWGTSIRGYGLGSVLIVLTFGLAAKILLQPSAGRLFSMFVVLLAAVQVLVNNTVLVFAICAAAIAVCLSRGRRKLALAFLAMLVAGGIFYLPYLKIYSGMDSRVILQSSIDLASLWHGLLSAFGEPRSILSALWCFLSGVVLIGATWRLVIDCRDKATARSEILLFGLLTILVSLGGYYVFLQRLSFTPHPWYYLTFLCLIAAALDFIISILCRFSWVRFARLCFVIALGVGLTVTAWPKIIEPQTNIDLVAHHLKQLANGKDLIVVNPWFYGVSFNRYYDGSAPWITLPAINEHRVHRFDLLRAKMTSPDPLGDVNDAMRKTLQSGNRLWIVGGAKLLGEEESPWSLPPAPNSQFGWQYSPYLTVWSRQLGAFIQKHAVTAEVVLPSSAGVNESENVPLWLAQGWKN